MTESDNTSVTVSVRKDGQPQGEFEVCPAHREQLNTTAGVRVFVLDDDPENHDRYCDLCSDSELAADLLRAPAR